jgi:hypothetical protein
MRKLVWLVIGLVLWGGVATAHPAHDGPGYKHRALYVRGWPCQEDEVIVGVGAYEDSRHEAYECVNVDEAKEAWEA